jgi:adenylate cyclase
MIDVTYAAIVTFLIYSLLTYTSYARAEAQRQEVRTAFSRYLSPTLVEQLADDPSRLQLGGEDRYMTLLFADVEHFTAISEQYDARSLTRLVNRFFTPMTDAILNWKGTVDKYMGDCIMAFWNAPLDDPQHAHNACLAALEMQERLIPLNQELRAEAEAEDRTYLPIHVGIGLNSGDCMVGNMGSDQRFDYSVLGDTVNVASRLEGQSRAYRVGIILGESVVQLVPELATLELDLVRVVGKSVPERIYTIVGDEAVATSEDFQTLKSSHEEMLAAYRAQDWSAAQDALMRCEELDARFGLHGYYEMFERRIGAFEARSPGADWDGVFVAETK